MTFVAVPAYLQFLFLKKLEHMRIMSTMCSVIAHVQIKMLRDCDLRTCQKSAAKLLNWGKTDRAEL